MMNAKKSTKTATTADATQARRLTREERLERWLELVVMLTDFADAVSAANGDRIIDDTAHGGLIEQCDSAKEILLNELPRA